MLRHNYSNATTDKNKRFAPAQGYFGHHLAVRAVIRELRLSYKQTTALIERL